MINIEKKLEEEFPTMNSDFPKIEEKKDDSLWKKMNKPSKKEVGA